MTARTTRRTRSRVETTLRAALAIQGAAAGGALPCGAAEAMIAHGNAGIREILVIQIGQARALPVEWQAKHLVKDAVVDEALPVDGNQAAAHHTRKVLVPMRAAQELHVTGELPLRHEHRAEALDR